MARMKGQHFALSAEQVRDIVGQAGKFGYSLRDAGFLAVVAMHGGYFLRRQYRQYCGLLQGVSERKLLSLACSNRHVHQVAGKTLFHLYGQSFYKAIGQPDNLSRMAGSRRKVKQKLLALDYLLDSNNALTWLLSEKQKTEYFRSLGIAADILPVSGRIGNGHPRRLADGLPILLKPGATPVVAFSYAHVGATSAGIERYLNRHEPLLVKLAERSISSEWVMLADSAIQFLRLRQAWRRWRAACLTACNRKEYFALRLSVERQQWSAMTHEAVDRYVQLQSDHENEKTQHLYQCWLESGAIPHRGGDDFAAHSCYREVLLGYDYSVADSIEYKNGAKCL